MRPNGLSLRIAVSTVLWFGVGAGAQAPFEKPEATMPAFAVVSVKPSAPDQKWKFAQTPDGVSIHRISVFNLIQAAYNLPEPFWVLGAPAWTQNEFYDIEAKVDEADVEALAKVNPRKRGEMLQAVLADRFRLKYHFDTKEMDDFVLVLAKGGPNAQNMKPADPSEKGPGSKMKGHFVYEAGAFTMEDLCYMVLSTESQRWVVDRTGLTGKYDFTLRWSRDEPPPADASAAPEPVGPSIFTAVQEQLGLKLEPAKVPTKVIVVEAVERPAANDR